MNKHLFFVCPNDYLEPVLNKSFGYTNHYYTSLGNSVVFDEDTICEIESLIRKHGITKICFVLSDCNPIIYDALGNQDFSEIRGLNHFYNEIVRQREYSENSWQMCNRQHLILAYYLYKKVEELQFGLSSLLADEIKISGKIYNKQENVFSDVYNDLICVEHFSLN